MSVIMFKENLLYESTPIGAEGVRLATLIGLVVWWFDGRIAKTFFLSFNLYIKAIFRPASPEMEPQTNRMSFHTPKCFLFLFISWFCVHQEQKCQNVSIHSDHGHIHVSTSYQSTQSFLSWSSRTLCSGCIIIIVSSFMVVVGTYNKLSYSTPTLGESSSILPGWEWC